MRTIENKIKREYHAEQLNVLKQKLAIKQNYVSNRNITKLFVPAIISFITSFVLLVVAVTILISSQNNNLSEPNDIDREENMAINDLKANTVYYIDKPIETIFDFNNDVLISIYYGLTTSNQIDFEHYLVFQYESEDITQLTTKAYPLYVDTEELEDYYLINQSGFLSNNAQSIINFKPGISKFKIEITIDNEVHILVIDLEGYYHYLID